MLHLILVLLSGVSTAEEARLHARRVEALAAIADLAGRPNAALLMRVGGLQRDEAAYFDARGEQPGRRRAAREALRLFEQVADEFPLFVRADEALFEIVSLQRKLNDRPGAIAALRALERRFATSRFVVEARLAATN